METTQVKETEALQIEEANVEHSTIREQIQNHIDGLSTDRLKVALDFLAYLYEKECEEATQELLAIPNFEQELAEAEQSVKEEGTVDWRSLRKEDA